MSTITQGVAGWLYIWNEAGINLTALLHLKDAIITMKFPYQKKIKGNERRQQNPFNFMPLKK